MVADHIKVPERMVSYRAYSARYDVDVDAVRPDRWPVDVDGDLFAGRVAFNAIAKHLDHGRRYTSRTSQVQRSFEDTVLKQRARGLVSC